MIFSERNRYMTTEVTQLPDLYQLLGLEPLEADRSKIEFALKRVLSQAKGLRSQHPKQAQRLVRVVELGKRHLLSSDAKAKYDARWLQVHRDTASTAEAECSKWDTRELEKYLPAGDPFQSFDVATFLEASESIPLANYAADYNKLLQMLQRSTQSEQAKANAEPATLPPTPAYAAVPFAAVSAAAPKVAQSAPIVRSTPRTASLAKQLRSKRDRSLLMIAAGVLLSLAVVLSVLFWIMNPADSESTNTLAANPNPNVVDRNPSRAAPEASEPRRGSGLPRVKGLDSSQTTDAVFATNRDGSVEDGSTRSDANDELDEMTGGMDDPAMADPIGDSIPMETTPTEPMSMSPSETDPADPEEENMAAPEPVLTEDEKQAWNEIMSTTRGLIGDQAYANAQKQLLQATGMAKSSEQRAQLERLSMIAKLAEEFHTALVSAVTALEAGEMIKVKTKEVVVVEVSPEKIIIESEGRRTETYQLTDIPIGLAYALADLKLDLVHPSSKARKAAFCLVHPRSNEIVMVNAREMMAEVIAAELVPEDFMKVFDEDYSLLSK